MYPEKNKCSPKQNNRGGSFRPGPWLATGVLQLPHSARQLLGRAAAAASLLLLLGRAAAASAAAAAWAAGLLAAGAHPAASESQQ